MQVKDANKKRRRVLVLAGICLVLQLALAPNLGLGAGRANFALVFAGLLALSWGGRGAVVGGFFAGLVFDLTSTSPIGLMALLLTIMSYALGVEERNRFGDGLVASLTSFGLGCLFVTLAYHLMLLLLGDAESFSSVLLVRTLPSFALTFVGFLPFAYHEVRRAGKGGGIVGGPSSSRRGGQHYDVSNL